MPLMELIEHNKHRTWSARTTKLFVVVFTTISYSVFAFSQKAGYDFYPDFRNTFTPKLRPKTPSLSLTNEEIKKRYAARLKTEGIAESKITRRTKLILT